MSHSSEIPLVQRRGKGEHGRANASRGRDKIRTRTQEMQVLLGSVLTTVIVVLLLCYNLDILSSGKWNLSTDVKIVDSHLTRRRMTDELVEDINRPYVVVFYSETCLGCKRIKRPYYQIAHEFNDINFYAVPAKMEDNKELVSEFEISFVPALYVVTKASGDVQRILYDGKPKYEDIKVFLKKYIGQISNSQLEAEENVRSKKMARSEGWV